MVGQPGCRALDMMGRLGLTRPAGGHVTQKQLDEWQTRTEKLFSDNESAQEELAKKNAQITAQDEKTAALQERIAQLTRDNDDVITLQADLARLRKQNQDLATQAAQLTNQAKEITTLKAENAEEQDRPLFMALVQRDRVQQKHTLSVHDRAIVNLATIMAADREHERFTSKLSVMQRTVLRCAEDYQAIWVVIRDIANELLAEGIRLSELHDEPMTETAREDVYRSCGQAIARLATVVRD
ncbi:hypothetical protein NX059_002741 [Plenodomus lindquistii]|nr:hypothetical protein NX059_002741 [Plenodomus lindquistii]